MKTQGVISELGEIISHDISFEPASILVFDRQNEREITRTILVECPGVLEEDVDWERVELGKVAPSGLAHT